MSLLSPEMLIYREETFGGMRVSGLGREGAREGIEEYLETRLGGFSL